MNLLNELGQRDRAITVDERPQEFVEALCPLYPPERAELLFGGGAVHGACAHARGENEFALAEVAEHAADPGFVIPREAGEDLGPGEQAPATDELEDGLPSRPPLLGGALFDVLDPALERAKAHAEHVGADLATDALSLELEYELREYLVRDLRERCASSTRRRKLSYEDRGLTNDGLDQNRDCHSVNEPGGPRVRPSTTLDSCQV